MDLEFQDQLMVTDAAYMNMVNRKAGALTGSAAEAGALAAGADDAQCDALQDFGVKLGSAWQIARDIGDLWGERGDGMTASNIIAKKKSLPVIHSLEHGNLSAKRELGSIYMKRALEPDDAARLVAILDETGARASAEDRASGIVEEALAAASAVVPDAGMGLLNELGQWALSGSR
jgi:geranylgeranyl pyrophosphate synthase